MPGCWHGNFAFTGLCFADAHELCCVRPGWSVSQEVHNKMPKLKFQPAVREQIKMRGAVVGPSGAGKTYSALEIATGVVGPEGSIAFIDTERGSARLYADKFKFDVAEWDGNYDPRQLVDLIHDAAASYNFVITDSLTHFYKGEGGVLDIVERAGLKAKGNTYAGWKEGTPVQEQLYAAIRRAPCHFLGTMRSKMEYVLQHNEKGKLEPVKVGMAPEQRAGAEYEFDFIFELDIDHNLTLSKSRSMALSDRVFKAGEVPLLAAELRQWLASGVTSLRDIKVALLRVVEKFEFEDPREVAALVWEEVGQEAAAGLPANEVEGLLANASEVARRIHAERAQPEEADAEEEGAEEELEAF